MRKGFDPADIEAASERLIVSGLLDDARFAAQFARWRMVSKGASKRHVGLLLSRKGIARDLANAVIEQVIEDEGIDTAAALDHVARRKLASLGVLEAVVIRRRLYSFLARRGYDVAEIRTVVDRLLRERAA